VNDVLPLSVDGLLVAASLAIYVRRRAGLPAGWLPWLGLVLGLVASLGANIAAAEPTVVGRVVAAWPPLAFGLAFELLVLLLRDATAQGDVRGAQIDPPALNEGLRGEDTGPDTLDEPDPGRWWATAPPAGEVAEEPGEDRVTELIAAGAGRRRLARELNITEHQARELLARGRNGSGVAG
jgi:hypothetical protein